MFDPHLVTCIPSMNLIANRLDHLPELSSWCTQECLESSYLASQLVLVNVVSLRLHVQSPEQSKQINVF